MGEMLAKKWLEEMRYDLEKGCGLSRHEEGLLFSHIDAQDAELARMTKLFKAMDHLAAIRLDDIDELHAENARLKDRIKEMHGGNCSKCGKPLMGTPYCGPCFDDESAGALEGQLELIEMEKQLAEIRRFVEEIAGDLNPGIGRIVSQTRTLVEKWKGEK